MTATLDIYNLALRHVGVSTEVQSLTERSKERAACQRYYEQAVDEVLRDFPWPFATRFEALAVVEEDPTSEWAFSYRWPADCLTPHRLLSGARNDSAASRIPYRIAGDVSGRLILTDLEDAELEYTARVTTVAQFAPDFVRALSLLLASYIGPSFGPDATRLANRALELYQMAIGRAQANAANEGQPDVPVESSFITVRD